MPEDTPLITLLNSVWENAPNLIIAAIALFLLYKKLDVIDKYLRDILSKLLEKVLEDKKGDDKQDKPNT